MKRILSATLLCIASAFAFAQTFPVQNLQVNGTSSFGGTMSGAGLASHDAGVNHVQTVANVAALRATSCVPGLLYADQGYATIGDNGQGTFVCNGGDTTTADNGGSILASASTYRLYLVSPNGIVNPKQFGAKCDGATNDIAAFTKAIAYANTLASSTISLTPGNATCKLNSGLTLNPNNFAFDMGGNTLDFSGMTSGAAISFFQSSTDANVRNALNRVHPISNGYLVGTSTSTGSVIAVNAQDNNPISGGYFLPGVVFHNVSFFNFYESFVFGNGAFLWTMDGGEIGGNFGTGFGPSITMLSTASNGGENITFKNYYFGLPLVFLNQNGNSSVFFENCSADYNTNVINAQAGYTEWNGYIENSTDLDYWVKVSGQNTTVRVTGTLVLTNGSGPKTAYPIFYSDSTVVNGGLDIDVARFFPSNAYTLNLIGGTGRALYRERGNYQVAAHPAIGAGTNLLRNGGFETSALTDWTLSGTPAPSISTTHARTGTQSLKIPGTLGQTTGVVTNVQCTAGKNFSGELWYLLDTLTGTGATFYVSVSFLDYSGAAISSVSVVAATTTVGAWTQAVLSPMIPAPVGTRSVSMGAQVFGVASGTPNAFVDDATLSCN